ncbi:hypothetical protein BgiBS90_021250 [Biomphalaria glabrata]|nr:hypothetical protein BgiBS90_021250 [Biomphalaria glabrata]
MFGRDVGIKVAHKMAPVTFIFMTVHLVKFNLSVSASCVGIDSQRPQLLLFRVFSVCLLEFTPLQLLLFRVFSVCLLEFTPPQLLLFRVFSVCLLEFTPPQLLLFRVFNVCLLEFTSPQLLLFRVFNVCLLEFTPPPLLHSHLEGANSEWAIFVSTTSLQLEMTPPDAETHANRLDQPAAERTITGHRNTRA